MNPLLRLLSTLLPALCALAAGPARALELADSRWGFDGSVVPGVANPVSFRLFNADNAPFDGVVRLERAGFAGAMGAVHEARVYVSPQTYRWVQFLVEPSGENDTFVFRYPLTARREETKTFADLKAGPGARVLLLNPADTSAVPPRMPAFPAEAFPASVAALGPLEQLVLDHAPDWDAPRRQALLDWVHLGGALHLLQDRDGRHPLLEGELAALNGGAPRARVGAGWVVRHDFTRREATAARLDEAGFPGSAWARENVPGSFAAEETGRILGGLKSFIRPQHPWATINLLLLLYIGLVGPGQYFLVKRRNLDYRVSLLILLGLVGAFSVVFYQIGLRGYKNPSMVLSLSRATVLPGDRVALTKWGQMFTRTSREARVRHPGTGGMYDLPGLDEKVPVTTANGAQAELSARMPVNSTLPLVFRGVLPEKVSGIERIAGDPSGLRFTGTPPEGLLQGAWFDAEGGRILTVAPDGSIRAGPRRTHAECADGLGHPDADSPWNLGGNASVPADLTGFLETARFREQFLPVWLARVLRASVPMPRKENYRNWLIAPAWKSRRSEVFLAARATPATAAAADGFEVQPGITVYHWILPDAPANTP